MKPFADWLREKIAFHQGNFTEQDRRDAAAVLAALCTRSAIAESELPGLRAALRIAETYLPDNDAIRFLRNDIKDRILKAESVASQSGESYGINIPNGLHPKTALLVTRFATALAQKLKKAEDKYGYDDGWSGSAWMEECQERLLEHVAKGDPRDVAAYCAFMWHHGWPTKAAPSSIACGDVRALMTEIRKYTIGEYAFRNPDGSVATKVDRLAHIEKLARDTLAGTVASAVEEKKNGSG